jgi:dephospho-CoA kinase
VPLLFEKDSVNKYDKIILVTCSEKIQKYRVLKRKGWDEKRFELTKKQQLEEREKKKLADIIINTDRGKRYVYNKITNILKKSAATKTRTNYEIVYNFKK